MFSDETLTDADVQKILVELNKTFPQKLDPFTTATSAELKDGSVEYIYILSNGINTADAQKLKYSMRMSSLIFVCKTEELQLFFDNNYDISYSYEDEFGKFLFTNRFSKNDCDFVGNASEEELADYYVAQIQKLIPWQTDNDTMFVEINRIGKTIIAKASLINFKKSDIDLTYLNSSFKNEYAQRLCIAPDARVLIKKGIKYKHIFYDKEGQKLIEILIDQPTCK